MPHGIGSAACKPARLSFLFPPPPHSFFFFFYGEIIIYSLISSCFYGNSMAALGGGVKTSRGNGNICEGAERVGARLRRVARGGKCPSPECRSRTCVHNHIHMLTSKSSGSSSEITNARVAVKQICIYKPPRRARALRTGGGAGDTPSPAWHSCGKSAALAEPFSP